MLETAGESPMNGAECSIARRITIAEYAEMQFDHPTELVRGRIVHMTNPGARHGFVCGEIFWQLRKYLAGNRLGRVLANDSGYILARDPDTQRGPDVSFISFDRLPDLPAGHPEVAPELAVEVLSPHDRWADVNEKVEDYLAAGVLVVVIADPERRVMHLFRPGAEPTRLAAADRLELPEILPGFGCAVGEMLPENTGQNDA